MELKGRRFGGEPWECTPRWEEGRRRERRVGWAQARPRLCSPWEYGSQDHYLSWAQMPARMPWVLLALHATPGEGLAVRHCSVQGGREPPTDSQWQGDKSVWRGTLVSNPTICHRFPSLHTPRQPLIL